MIGFGGCHCFSVSLRRYSYPIQYGFKYCSAFKATTFPERSLFTNANTWRDRTLICLQTSLAAWMNSQEGTPSCQELTRFAFESHPPCYTQEEASICSLDPRDQLTIAGVVSVEDLATVPSAVQTSRVIQHCGERIWKVATDAVDGDSAKLRAARIKTAEFVRRARQQ